MNERKPVVVMSWALRQNKKKEAVAFSAKLVELVGKDQGVEKILLPSMGMIPHVAEIIRDSAIELGAQNIGPKAYGMFSGEYSIDSLIDEGGKYVELGHWERRTLFSESDQLINEKVLLTLENGLVPIICMGETEATDDYKAIELQLYRQLFNDLMQVSIGETENIIIAYTPMWAVSKTKAANVPHIHKVIGIMRDLLAKLFGPEFSQQIRIIYGGSVSPENARLIVQNSEIDGVFVGRFGSEPDRYEQVVKIVEANNHKEFHF